MKMRIRDPFTSKQVEEIKEKWLIIDHFDRALPKVLFLDQYFIACIRWQKKIRFVCQCLLCVMLQCNLLDDSENCFACSCLGKIVLSRCISDVALLDTCFGRNTQSVQINCLGAGEFLIFNSCDL